MEKKWLLTGVVLIILSIILGAFGAHALSNILNDQQLLSYETGVRYQMYHGIAFLVLPFVFNKINTSGKASYWLLLIGVILFSGSIYGLTFSTVQQFFGLKKIFGPLTPIGGAVMIIGWLICCFKILKWNNGKA